MCSRYTLTSPPEAVRAYFRYANEAEFPPRYNIAPSQPVAIVRDTPRGGREMALVRWGLIPSWVKDPRAFKMLINARSESAVDKPSFRAGLHSLPPLNPAGLRDCQITAITNLEASLKEDRLAPSSRWRPGRARPSPPRR